MVITAYFLDQKRSEVKVIPSDTWIDNGTLYKLNIRVISKLQKAYVSYFSNVRYLECPPRGRPGMLSLNVGSEFTETSYISNVL